MWFNANEYNRKNVRLQMGRCPVRAIFQEALQVLAKNQDKFRYEGIRFLDGD